jgi:hypothetical protein
MGFRPEEKGIKTGGKAKSSLCGMGFRPEEKGIKTTVRDANPWEGAVDGIPT